MEKSVLERRRLDADADDCSPDRDRAQLRHHQRHVTELQHRVCHSLERGAGFHVHDRVCVVDRGQAAFDYMTKGPEVEFRLLASTVANLARAEGVASRRLEHPELPVLRRANVLRRLLGFLFAGIVGRPRGRKGAAGGLSEEEAQVEAHAHGAEQDCRQGPALPESAQRDRQRGQKRGPTCGADLVVHDDRENRPNHLLATSGGKRLWSRAKRAAGALRRKWPEAKMV
mmetsp:Transcript_88044/g.269374  ORF Transcript_88044/g.269374 Transcript_88044/m.269374 type:complete len:228 (+) Transcript_88044:1049-1732(+)